MPKMKKDEAVRAALIKDGSIADRGFSSMYIRTTSKAQSQAAAIAARRAEFAKQGKGGSK